MNIPYVDSRDDLDCCVRMYRRAIYNTLRELRPKYSLEVGTYTYQSSSVFSRYYQEYDPDGLLITADIATWNRGEAPPNVYPVMVYPHIIDSEKYHGGIDIYYRDYKDKLLSQEGTVEINICIIREEMVRQGMDGLFGLSFIDGDHQKISFLRDLAIAKSITEQEGWILIDDIADNFNPQAEVYRGLKEYNDFYEFSDWRINPGMGLIKNKDLVLI